MDYPTFDVSDIAEYSGRPLASYPPYADEALLQATMLFQIASCLKEWPILASDQALARLGILSMADSAILAQPYQQIMASPLQSESIGSYSYSKMAATLTAAGSMITSEIPTGVFWFDLAISRLGVCEVGAGVYSGSIGVFEYDSNIQPDGTSDNNKKRLIGPVEIDPINLPFVISSDQQHTGRG